MSSLNEKVAVVTGASRGAGRGIALALGRAGATVIVTGRSVRQQATTEDLPGTVDDTADEVTIHGGKGIALRCDHTCEEEVVALFARVRHDYGRLDVLVNNVWGGYEQYDLAEFTAPFWEQPARRWEQMFVAGVRAHLLCNQHAAPLLIERKQGLIVHTTAWDRDRYLGNLVYDVAKAAINRIAFGSARELRPHGVTVLALAPGFMRTERVLATVRNDPTFDIQVTESPEYVGRAVVALASDPQVARWTGQVVAVGQLARAYEFTDVDGRQIPPFELPE